MVFPLDFGMNKKNNLSIKLSYQEPAVHEALCLHLSSIFADIPQKRKLVVVCIGTDRSTGDSLGPLVGSYLRKSKQDTFPVFGTLDEPVHAVNLKDTIDHIQQTYIHPFILAVDACLGQYSSVGMIQISHGPVKPGAGVNKDLPPVGDAHITGIVNVCGFMEYFVLQNTRLSLVIKMSEIIANSIESSLLTSQANQHVPFLQLD